MTVCICRASGIAAVALSIGLVLAPAACAQDAMQLDIDFKNSLPQRPDVQRPPNEEGRYFRGRHQRRHNEGRQAGNARRHEKERHGESVARR